MKIISKFKDYYDYLQGIYGMDEKLVLDRTEFYKMTYLPSDYTKVRFWICDYKVEGMFYKGEFLYGKELELFHEKVYNSNYWIEKDNFYTIHDDYKHLVEVLKIPTLFQDLPRRRNKKGDIIIEDCPNTQYRRN